MKISIPRTAYIIFLTFIFSEVSANQNIASRMTTLPEGCYIPNSMVAGYCSEGDREICVSEINEIAKTECVENHLKECLIEDATLDECMLDTVGDTILHLISLSTVVPQIIEQCTQIQNTSNPMFEKALADWEGKYADMASKIKHYSMDFWVMGVGARGVKISEKEAEQWFDGVTPDPFELPSYLRNRHDELSDESKCEQFAKDDELNDIALKMEYYYRNYEYLFIKLFGV